MSQQPAGVTREMEARLANRTIIAMSNNDHKGCAAGHTTEQHLKLCHACWVKNHHLKEDAWHGQIGCPMYSALVADNLMPLDTEGMDAITIHRLQADHKRNYEGCALMACGLTRYTKDLMADWRDYRRQAQLALADYERKQAHSLSEPRHIRRGRWGTISKEVFFENQILYTIEGLSMDGLRGRPFAKIRMTSSNVILYVDLSVSLRTPDKNLRKKFFRRGKPTHTRELTIANACHQAAEHYLSH